MVKDNSKLIETKQKPRAVNADVHRGFADNPDPYMLAGVRKIVVEVWIQLVGEEKTKTIWFPSYYPKPVQLKKYDHSISFLKVAWILRHHRAHVVVFDEEVFYLYNMVRKAASVT